MLTPAELTEMRAAAAASHPEMATLRRRTVAPDGQGGHTATWTDQGTVSGRLVPWSRREPGEREEGGRPVAVSSWRWLCPPESDIRPEDRLRIGSAEYEVAEAVHAGSEALELRVALRRVR